MLECVVATPIVLAISGPYLFDGPFLPFRQGQNTDIQSITIELIQAWMARWATCAKGTPRGVVQFPAPV